MGETMTDSDVRTETWKPIPGAGYYEASDQGRVRSVDRTIDGRHYDSVTLKPREDGDGYLVVNYTDDARVRHHGVSVARLVLLAHDPEGYAPGLEACHGPAGRKDNRRVNLRWDTDEANRIEALELRLQNSPPKPKPLKTCPRCGAQHGGRGQNCHDCVVGLGTTAAVMLSAGAMLDKVSAELEYPPAAAYNLAVKYGDLRVTLGNASADYAERPASWLRRVLFRREASRQNSDGQ
jgi:hypothetical protein